MKKTKKRALYILAALLAVVFVLACLAGFAACGGSDDTSTADCGDGNHTVASWTTVTEATCTSKGSESGTCTVCGKTVTQDIPMKDHTSDEGTVTKAATCTDKGETTYKCTVCGTELGTEDIAALGHTYDGLAYDATNSKLVTVCSRCGETATGEAAQSIDAKEYTFEAEDMILNAGTSTHFGVEEHNTASGGANVKDFESGTSVTFIITASAATQAVLTVRGASNNSSMTTTDVDMSEADVTLNDEAITLSGIYEGGGLFVYDKWCDATATINLKQGDNTIVFYGMAAWSALSAKPGQYNFDCIRVAVPTATTLKVSSSVCEDTNCGGHKLVGTYDSTTSSWTYACTLCEETVTLANALVKSLTSEVTESAALVGAIEAGGTVILSDEISDGITVTSALDVTADTTLDLNGNTITTGDSFSSSTNTVEVSSGATLTIKDSAGSGSIANTYTGATSTDNAAAIYVAEGGTLVLESGAIESSSIGIKAEGVDTSSETRATVTINGGEISSTYFSIFAAGDVDVTISGGTISGESKGICIDGDSDFGYGSTGNYNYGTTTTLTVTGGEISCESDSAICTLGGADASSAVITISGGTISNSAQVSGSDTSITAPPAVYVPNGTLTITGGTITSTLTAVEIRGGTAKISGGTLITTYNDANGAGDDATQSTFGAKTYGYALSVYAYGVNSTINKRLTDSEHTGFTNDVNVTVTGGTFVGGIYVAAEAEYSVSGNAKWKVVLNGTEEEKASANYVVTMTGIEFVGYKSDGDVATGTDTVAYYLYAVDSKLAAIDSTSDADDLVYSGTGQDAKSVEGYGYEIVISTDASDGSVKYTLVGEAGTMDASLASWFGKGAAEGDAYVTVKLYVGSENTISYTSAGGEDKTYDSNEFTSDGYYIFAYRLTGTLDDGTAVSPSSAKVYTVKDSSGNELYTVTIDYTQITITEATVEG